MNSSTRPTEPPSGLSPERVYALLRHRSLPQLQVAEAAMAIDANCTEERLIALLDAGDRSPAEHAADVAAVLADLASDGLVVVGDDGQLLRPPGMAQLIERPLGLGQTLRATFAGQPADTMKRILRSLGVKPPARRADITEAAVRRLGDPVFVRELVATAPESVREILLAHARGEDSDSVYDPRRFDADRYRREQEARVWASERGLVVSGYYGYSNRMPAEVALALLGPDLRAPFTPVEPPLHVRPVGAERLAGYSAAAATDFADHALAILDRVARHPVPRLKSGGVGVRELAKLGKVTQSDPVTARLVLELAVAAKLLGYLPAEVAVTSTFGPWRDSDPADRLVVLMRAWWSYGGVASSARKADGATRPALEEPASCSLCTSGRQVVVSVLAEVDGGVDATEVAARARWRAPFAHLGAEREPGVEREAQTTSEDRFALLWRELAVLGVVADGALTPVGRAVLARQWSRAAKELATAMPPAADQALFGADLTAYVTGAPTSGVSTLLDSAADREGRGGAVAWRFSPGSVRRALDAGATAASLIEDLAAISDGPLPQPLTYLIEDVGQRHGSMLVSGATSMIRSDDAVLLAQVVADRKLKGLGLRRVGPTVVASRADPDALLTALRAAGYLPMPEGQGRG